MDYKKKYEKLVDAVKVLRDNNPSDEGIQNWVNDNVPELKESEDERIRKAILEGLIDCRDAPDLGWSNFGGIEIDDCIAWLEKQGNKPQGKSALEAIREEKVDNVNKIEPKDYSSIDPYFGKPIDKVEPKFKVGDIVQYMTDSTDRRKIEEIDTLCNMYHTDSSSIMFEVEDEWKAVLISENVEQNPSDKVEPKFHKGEWTVSKLDRKARQISEVHFDEYNSYYVVNGKSVNLEEYDRLHHSWTIQDAKDGDVLATEDKNFTTPFVAIYKSIGDTVYDNITFNSHCFIGFDGNFYGGEEGHTIEDIHPATKEQRKLLSQRMKEAGYEWDANKKELIKVEQNNTNCSDGL